MSLCKRDPRACFYVLPTRFFSVHNGEAILYAGEFSVGARCRVVHGADRFHHCPSRALREP